MKDLTCKQLTRSIQAVKKQKVHFDDVLADSKIGDCLIAKSELIKLIKEIDSKIWLLEKLTLTEIGKQYNEWHELYENLDADYKLPSKERILEFLKNDQQFIELMKTKEKQGLTRLIIAPAPGFYSLKKLADQIDKKVRVLGGETTFYSPAWQDLLRDEDMVQYFSTISGSSNRNPEGGVSVDQIKQDPEKYGICDGWMVSFTTNEQNITGDSESDISTGDERKTMKTNSTAFGYQYELYSGEAYKGEEAIILQEYFALFARDLFEKYIKTKKLLSSASGKSMDLIDSRSVTLFISNYLRNGLTHSLCASWAPINSRFDCRSQAPSDHSEIVGIRTVVRRKIKS